MTPAKREISPPRFMLEGYALYDECDGVKMPDGKKLYCRGMDFIGVKPDAPQWAKDEYRQWVEAHQWAKDNNMKL